MLWKRAQIIALVAAMISAVSCGFTPPNANRTFLYWAESTTAHQQLHGVSITDTAVTPIVGLPTDLPQGTYTLAVHGDLLALRVASGWPVNAPQHFLLTYRVDALTGKLTELDRVVLDGMYKDYSGEPLILGSQIWFGPGGRYLYLDVGGYWHTLGIFGVDGGGHLKLADNPIYGWGNSIASDVSATGTQFCEQTMGWLDGGVGIQCSTMNPATGRPDLSSGYFHTGSPSWGSFAFSRDTTHVVISELGWTNGRSDGTGFEVYSRAEDDTWSSHLNRFSNITAFSLAFDATEQFVLAGDGPDRFLAVFRVADNGVMTESQNSPLTTADYNWALKVDRYNRAIVLASSSRYLDEGTTFWKIYAFDSTTEQLHLQAAQILIDASGSIDWVIANP